MSKNTEISALLAKADRKTVVKYIQFSKRIVAGISIAITIICCVAIILCYAKGDTDSIVGLVGSYCNFATIAFVSYSVNSVGEKILKAYTPANEDEEEDQETEG